MAVPSLIGRDGVLDAVGTGVGSAGVAICGAPGSGVSRVLIEVARRAAGAVRFVNLAHEAVPTSHPDDGLLVVDDVHLARDAQVVVLRDAALRGGVVFGVHPHRANPDVEWLWLSGCVQRVDLPPLDLDQTAALLASLSTPGLHPALVVRAHQACAGRAGWLADLADDVRTGSTPAGIGELVPGPALIRRARALLRSLDADDQHALALLATARSLPTASPHGAALLAERWSGVVVADHDDTHVRCEPPIAAAAVHAALRGPLRRATTAAVLAVPELSDRDRVRLQLDDLDDLAGLDPALIDRVCDAAIACGDLDLAVRLARAQTISRPCAEATARRAAARGARRRGGASPPR